MGRGERAAGVEAPLILDPISANQQNQQNAEIKGTFETL